MREINCIYTGKNFEAGNFRIKFFQECPKIPFKVSSKISKTFRIFIYFLQKLLKNIKFSKEFLIFLEMFSVKISKKILRYTIEILIVFIEEHKHNNFLIKSKLLNN